MAASSLLLTLASGDKPMFTNPTIEWVKGIVNALSVPEISLTFFFLPLFIIMLVWYRQWTKPKVALGLLVIFCVFYFGSLVIDHNYLLIIQKPDNVPITIMLLSLALCLWMAFRQAAINDSRLEAGKPLLDAMRGCP